jgi:hypothetical protein
MTDAELARLFEALHGTGDRPDIQTRKKAARRLVFSGDGLTLIKHFSPCLQANVNAFSRVSPEYLEGRRSVLWEIIMMATAEQE